MSAPSGTNFANNYSSGAPSTLPMPADQPPVRGGKYAFVVSATTYPTTCKLQYINRANVAIDILTFGPTNSVSILDLPAGQYQISLAGGTAVALNIDLVSVPQD